MNLELLLHEPVTWQDDAPRVEPAGLPTGFPELDALLPEAGWPQGALTELLVPREGVGTLQLLLPALAQISQQRRWIAWVSPPYVPYAPALAAAGVDLSRVLLIHPRAGHDGLSAVERSLRSGTCGAVLAWPMAGDGHALRRLQLAAEAGDAWGVLFRPEQLAEQASPIDLRLHVVQRSAGVEVYRLKRRGGCDAGPVVFPVDRLLQPQSMGQRLS